MEQTLNVQLCSSSACGCKMFFRTLIQPQAAEGRLLWMQRLVDYEMGEGGGEKTFAVLNFLGSARSSFWFED